MSTVVPDATATIPELTAAVRSLLTQVERLAQASTPALERLAELSELDDEMHEQLEAEGITALHGTWLALADHALAAAGEFPTHGTVIGWFEELAARGIV